VLFRSNVCVADTDQAALDHAATFMGDTFGAYRSLGLEEKTTIRVHRSFEEEVSGRAIVGSAATCVDRLRALVDRYPISHLQLRPQGPGFVGGEQGLRESLRLLASSVLPKLL